MASGEIKERTDTALRNTSCSAYREKLNALGAQPSLESLACRNYIVEMGSTNGIHSQWSKDLKIDFQLLPRPFFCVPKLWIHGQTSQKAPQKTTCFTCCPKKRMSGLQRDVREVISDDFLRLYGLYIYIVRCRVFEGSSHLADQQALVMVRGPSDLFFIFFF